MAAQSPADETSARGPVAGARCNPISIKLRSDDPPIEVHVKLRPTAEGDVADQLVLERPEPALNQVLRVKDMDALSVLDKCSVRARDISFDGWKDLLVDTRAGAANTYVRYWIYNPTSRGFAELGEYPEFQIDDERRRLQTYERDGSAGREYTSREYSFSGGALVLEKQDKQIALSDDDAYERTVSVRKGADMTVVKRQRVAPP